MNLISFAEAQGKDVFLFAEAVWAADKKGQYERLKEFGIIVTRMPDKLPVINYKGVYYMDFPSVRAFIKQLKRS